VQLRRLRRLHARIGQYVSEVLDYEPASFQVVCHVGPKLACGSCNKTIHAAAPAGRAPLADPGVLAHCWSESTDYTPR
jgi:transposase